MKTNVSLRPYNSFGFNAMAKYFIEINNVEDLLQLIGTPEFKNENRLVLSGGNNILLTNDYFDGIVILMNNKGIEVLKKDDNVVVVRAQGGEDWPEFVRSMVARGFYGVENLALIPGKVGAAPVQNIGAYGMELKDSFLQCEAIELATGKRRIFKKDECHFGYRHSIFKDECKGQFVIVSVDFQLSEQAELKLEYGNIRTYLAERGVIEPSLQQFYDAICAIRNSKLPDPKAIGNAGSFFKNPVINIEQFSILQQQFPDIPHYPDINGNVKVPAGWLIERAGWKGWRDQHVGVYEKQALVLVHFGGGTGKDIVALSQKIQISVMELFGIQIVPEVNYV